MLAVALSLLLAATPRVQERDTLRRDTLSRHDTTAARLPAVEVTRSILPIAGPQIGSGVPARISVISGAEAGAWEPRVLSDALAREAGVSLYDDLGSAHRTTLVARGFTAGPVVGLPQGVSVFVDGVPVNEPDAGQVNFDLLPLAYVQQLEVLSGTASLLGPHSLGGAINLVTRRGEDTRGGEIEVTAGSFDTYSVEASHGGRAGGDWRYYAGAGYSTDGGWRQVTGARHRNGFLNAGRRWQTGALNLQAYVANGYAETAGSLPLSAYRIKPDSNLSAQDFEDIGQVHVAVSGQHRLRGGHASGVVWLRRSDAERFNVNQQTDPDVRSFSVNRSIGASADWRAGRAAGVGVLGLRFGVGGSASQSRVRIFAERIDARITTDVESPIAKADAYGLVDYAVGPVTLSGGLRYDVVRVPFRNRLDAARDTTSTFRRFSPRGGVSIALGRSGSVYVSAGQSFRAPALIELACADPAEPCPLPFALGDDPPLDPVVATTAEVGWRAALGPAELTASAYHTNVRDDIFLLPYVDAGAPSGSTIDGYFANLAKTRRDGVELGARVALGGLSVFATYAYTRATFQVDGVEIFSIREEAGGENEVGRGDRLPLIPDHTASISSSLALPRGLRGGFGVRYVGERVLRGDEANEEAPLGSYWVADVRAGFELADWELEAIVRNLFGSDYASFGTFNLNQGAGGVLERFLTPGTPRTFQLVLRRRLGGGGEN